MTANVISTHQSDPSVLLQNPLVAAMDETSYRVNEQTLPEPGTPLTLIFDASQPGARRVFLTGKVQGVGFRAFTQEQAELLGVTGYVRNLTDGRVEALAEGRRAVLAELMRRLEAGPSAAEVRSMETEDLPSSEQYETFTIHY
jgi:acylphosphatase